MLCDTIFIYNTILYTGKFATCVKHAFFKTHVKPTFYTW